MNVFDFKRRDAASYDPFTDSFDRFTRRQTTLLAQEMTRLAHVRPGQSVLDVGTGTGIVALGVAQKVAPGGRVVGIDLSEGMLAAAAVRAKEEGMEAIQFLKMDAESLALPTGSFDAVVSLFALFHFPNPGLALREMCRVLRPGGRLVVGVGVGPRLLSWSGVRRAIVRVVNRLRFGSRRLVAPGCLEAFIDRHLPIPAEPEVTSWSRQRGVHQYLLDLTREAGFVQIREGWAGCETRYDSAEEFWEVQATFSSVARKRLAAAPAGTVALLREEFFARCRDVLNRGGRLVYPTGAYFVSGVRPESVAPGAGAPRG